MSGSPANAQDGDVTTLIGRMSGGDAAASAELYALVHDAWLPSELGAE